MFFYSKGEKTPFYRAQFQVSYEGTLHCGYGTNEINL
jgi:hypothetical protein